MPPAPSVSELGADSPTLERQASAWLVISLLSSIACASLCLGIGGAVFCYLALEASKNGYPADAEDKLRWGKILTLAGSAIGIVATTLALILLNHRT